MSYFWKDVEFPKYFLNPRFVETVEGCFTLAVDIAEPLNNEDFNEDRRKELRNLTHKVLKKYFGNITQLDPEHIRVPSNAK